MPLTDPQPPEATPDYLYTGSYDSSGNPYDSASGCAMDGQPLPCTLLLRLRATGRGLTSAGMESASGGTHVRVDEWDEYGLPGAGDVFEFDGQGVRYGGDAGNVVARNVGSYRFVQTGSVRTTITQRPQNSNFLIGRFGFSQDEMSRVRDAYGKITSPECERFFDDTLAALRQKGGISNTKGRFTPTTLRGLLVITTLNRYRADLTARSVGVGEEVWADTRRRFESQEIYARTLKDGRIFLGDLSFYEGRTLLGRVTDYFLPTDLAGVIVHELFHRAGLTHGQIYPLHGEIQKNCGDTNKYLPTPPE